MKILFISSLFPPNSRGGAEISTLITAQGLIELGHRVDVITSGKNKNKYYFGGVPVTVLPIKLTAKPLLEKINARRNANKLIFKVPELTSYDIIHAHDLRSAQLVSELDNPFRIVTVRDYAQICGSPNNMQADGTMCSGCDSLTNVLKNQAIAEAPLVRKPFRAFQYRYNIKYRRSSFARIPNHIYLSNSQREVINAHQSLSNINNKVIYNPVAANYLTKKLSPAIGKTILFVGTTQKYKGIDLLIDAFTQLAKSNNNAQLKIIGDGQTRSVYEQEVARRGLQYRINFTGRISQERMLKHYDEAAVVVSPHRWIEPFGRTVVEAMARGRIVVAANSGGPGEIIKNNVTGLLFAPNSVSALQQNLTKALAMRDLEKRTISLAAHAWVKTHLNQRQIAQEYEKVYRKIIELQNNL